MDYEKYILKYFIVCSDGGRQSCFLFVLHPNKNRVECFTKTKNPVIDTKKKNNYFITTCWVKLLTFVGARLFAIPYDFTRAYNEEFLMFPCTKFGKLQFRRKLVLRCRDLLLCE